jgi:hypothetical protein
MGGMRIPAHLQDLAQRVAAKSWTKAKSFPRDVYFQNIDIFAKTISDINGGEVPQNKSLAEAISIMVEEENSLLAHVLKKNIGIKDDAEWSQMCKAAAWVILQEYNNAKKSGKWTP